MVCYIRHEVSSVSVKVNEGTPKPALFLAETCEDKEEIIYTNSY